MSNPWVHCLRFDPPLHKLYDFDFVMSIMYGISSCRCCGLLFFLLTCGLRIVLLQFPLLFFPHIRFDLDLCRPDLSFGVYHEFHKRTTHKFTRLANPPWLTETMISRIPPWSSSPNPPKKRPIPARVGRIDVSNRSVIPRSIIIISWCWLLLGLGPRSLVGLVTPRIVRNGRMRCSPKPFSIR